MSESGWVNWVMIGGFSVAIIASILYMIAMASTCGDDCPRGSKGVLLKNAWGGWSCVCSGERSP